MYKCRRGRRLLRRLETTEIVAALAKVSVAVRILGVLPVVVLRPAANVVAALSCDPARPVLSRPWRAAPAGPKVAKIGHDAATLGVEARLGIQVVSVAALSIKSIVGRVRVGDAERAVASKTADRVGHFAAQAVTAFEAAVTGAVTEAITGDNTSVVDVADQNVFFSAVSVSDDSIDAVRLILRDREASCLSSGRSNSNQGRQMHG